MQNIALMSYCCDTGVGFAGFDFYSHLPFSRWIVVPHRRLGVRYGRIDARCHILSQDASGRSLEEALTGVTAIFCIERGYFPSLFRLARRMGIRTILMPMAEWFRPNHADMFAVDTFLAPTIACFEMLERRGFGSRTQYIPYPIDTERFRYRVRTQAEIFLHCGGWGGYKGRKGTDIVLAAATKCPEITFAIRSQASVGEFPANVFIHGAVVEPEEQYAIGDVCIQPSRWEGVGLQILESMACGIPVLVPDAPPMNEHQADNRLRIPARPSQVMIGSRPWTQWEMDLESLTEALWKLHRLPIQDLSAEARKAAEQRSWDLLRPVYGQAFTI